ncbi:hypothetical protein D3C72_909940 [compost metagenome]
MNVGVDPAGGDDLTFGGDHFCRRANRDRHAGLDIRVPGFADGEDSAIFDADIRLHDPPVIDDQRVGQHQIHARLRRHLPLAHAVADHFPAAKFHLFAVDREIVFHLDPQFGVGQPHFIAHGRAKHIGIRLTRNLSHCGPPVRPSLPRENRKCAAPRRPVPASLRAFAPARSAPQCPPEY